MQNLPIDEHVKYQVKKKKYGSKMKFMFGHEEPGFKRMLDEVSRNFGFKENYTGLHKMRLRQSLLG